MKQPHRQNLLLYNVLNQEIVFQEFFCNLLIFDQFRELFLEFVNTNNNVFIPSDIKYNNFNTEEILSDNDGRSDLVLNWNNKKYIFEIKNKDNTKLTDNQPESYLKNLNDNSKHLFFLIPKTYHHTDNIIDRWKYKNNYNKVEDQIFYWEDFILKIEANEIEKSNPYIEMFYRFCKYWFNMDPVEFTKVELNLLTFEGNIMELIKSINVPNLMQKLERVVVDCGEKLGFKRCTSQGENGFCYTKKINSFEIFLGIDYEIWEKEELPVSIIIQNQKEGYKKFENPFPDKPNLIKEFLYNDGITFAYIVNLDKTIGSSDFEKNLMDKVQDISISLNNPSRYPQTPPATKEEI